MGKGGLNLDLRVKHCLRELYAVVVAGFAGAGTTLAAARAATSAGFTGRHESTHRSELAELDRNLHRYRSASQSGSEMSFQEEDNFRENLNASQQSLNEYYRSPNAYKDEYWFRLPSKIKKRNVVRKMKRAARDANQGNPKRRFDLGTNSLPPPSRHKPSSPNPNPSRRDDTVDTRSYSVALTPRKRGAGVGDIGVEWHCGGERNLSDCGPNSDASSIFAESGSLPVRRWSGNALVIGFKILHRDQLQFFKDALFLPAAGVCGPFVPQLMYKPRTNSDRDRYYVEEIEMEAPIPFWMENPSECGIPLSDALRSRVRRLLKRDETVFEGRGPSVTIRLEWPGYRQWSRQLGLWATASHGSTSPVPGYTIIVCALWDSSIRQILPGLVF
ncbi:hypothetical protein C8J57DRAFT_1237573 [Mycena rebaudengoi]|nr:hypothetical protein C8J57DRAFT_1237573 [Mycena rebaudengoi]